MLYLVAYSIGMFCGVGLIVALRRLNDNFADKCSQGFTLKVVRPAVNDAQVIGVDSLAVFELVENHGKDGVWRFPMIRPHDDDDETPSFDDLDVIVQTYTLQGM